MKKALGQQGGAADDGTADNGFLRLPSSSASTIEGGEVSPAPSPMQRAAPLFGVNWPPIRVTEEQRKLQAQVVRDFVDGILDDDPEALVLVAGDLNDFQFGELGEGNDHPVAILEGIGGGVPLTKLVNLEKDDERFAYLYGGNSQVLDHMLVSPALYELFVAVDALHFNASYPADLAEDATTTLRVSDHDPLEGRFMFEGEVGGKTKPPRARL